MIEFLPIGLALIVTGMVAGVLAGLLGVGGGIVIVPVLFFIFQLLGISSATAMSVATGTSLVTIIATSISSVRAHRKKGNVQFDIVKTWGLGIIVGVGFGALFATRAGGGAATLVFGIIAIAVAMNMLFRAKAKAVFDELPGKLLQTVFGVFTGAVSVVMGIGGGTLGVPILSAFNVQAHKAVGTAAAFGLIIALPGALLMLLTASTPEDAPVGTFGFVNVIGAALIIPLTTFFAPVGVWLGSKMDAVLLKRVFAIFLCISGSRMIYQSLF